MLSTRTAHRTLDARVERLYRAKRFTHDTECVQHLI
ncbi:type IIL restriction-modification enzyme MmeI [Hymenobacter nivis]|nr:type IIL restriction-modification enzyme MmeI [Hymenobacter nivis]